jgi:hypothetical protein
MKKIKAIDILRRVQIFILKVKEVKCTKYHENKQKTRDNNVPKEDNISKEIYVLTFLKRFDRGICNC